jgi:vacuolar-type H+-ATPase subunit F/Vma7
MDVFVMVFDRDKTPNSNHGTVFANPVKDDLASIVFVRFRNISPMKRKVTESQTSSIMPTIVATNIIAE